MLRSLPVVLLLVYLLAAGAPLRAADDDALLALMSGEFALQEGRFADAAEAYVQAAEQSSDPALAERAARVSLLAESPTLSTRALARWRRLDPESPGARQMAVVLALRSEQVDAALDALRGLLADADEQGWRLALQALAGERESKAVAEVMKRLLAEDRLPDALEPLLGFGGLAQRLGLSDVSTTLARRVTERHPQLPRPWLWRAEIERQQGDQAAALASVRKALAVPDLDTPLRLSAAAMLDALGEPLAAAAALSEGEQSDATLAGRAAYLARADATEALDALYAELQLGPTPLPSARLFLLGQLAELREQPAQALAWYRQVEDPDNIDQAQLRIAMVLDQSGDLDAALASLRAYQQSDSENGEALVNAYLLEADMLQRRSRFEEALATYERGLGVFEDDPELIYARALGLEKLDRIDEALRDLRHLHALDPDNPDTLNALGYTLADRTDRYDEALSLIDRALSLKPDNPAIIDSMGWVLFKLGRLEESLVHLRRAFELQRDAEVAAHLAEALWASGRKEEANSILRLGAEIDPENRVLKRTRERLQP